MNTQIQDIKKILRISTIVLIIATLLTPLIFSSSLFFPYIVGKALFMRSMILLATISYVGLILIDKNSRPKKSYLLYAISAFSFILILATLNSVNPDRSLWSNFERMEGLVTILYMAVLFVISSSVLRLKEWVLVMNSSIVISLVVGIHAISKATQSSERIAGLLGNSTYLGVYALIHLFLAVLAAAMIFRGNREKELLLSGEHKSAHKLNTSNWISIALYILTAVFNAFVLFKTGTRGAFVGLVLGLIVASIYLVWKEKNKIIRFGAMGFLVAVLVSVIFLGIFKNSAVVQNSNQLSRFAGLITTDYKKVLQTQGEARTMVWSMAYEGFKERPILGWGQDNFGYVFAKYYNPGMYAQEQWFDRSHNVFMDWLIAGGILGLFGYLSLFAIAIYFIFSKKTQLTIIEKSIWLGLLVAYFVHNMFVFDNLSSYVLFFLILAYINDRHTHDRNEKNENHILNDEQKNKIILIFIISLSVVFYLGYHTVLKPYTQNKGLINILQSTNDLKSVNVIDKNFKSILNLGPTGQLEIFEQVATFLPRILSHQTIPVNTKESFIKLFEETVSDYDKKISDDARYNYFVAVAYRSIAAKEKALIYANKAYELSPEKQSFVYLKSLVLLDYGNSDEIVSLLKKTYENETKNETAFNYYVSVLLDKTIKSKYNPVLLNEVANVLVDGYKKEKHDVLFEKELWDLISDKRNKTIFANKIIELLPEKKNEIINLSK